jgi:hypothetical protein
MLTPVNASFGSDFIFKRGPIGSFSVQPARCVLMAAIVCLAAGCGSNQGPITNAYLRAQHQIDVETGTQLRHIPKTVPPRLYASADAARAVKEGRVRIPASFVKTLAADQVAHYAKVIDQCRQASEILNGAQTRISALDSANVDAEVVREARLQEEAIGKYRTMLLEIAHLTELTRDQLIRRQQTSTLDKLLDAAVGGAAKGAVDGSATGTPEIGAAIEALDGILKLAEKTDEDRTAINSQAERAKAAAMDLQQIAINAQTSRAETMTYVQGKRLLGYRVVG